MPRRTVERVTKVPEIRKGDLVVVLAGKDAGKRGKVEQVINRLPSPSVLRSGFRRGTIRGGVDVVVEGVNIARKHTKPRQRTQGGPGSMPTVEPGGILDHALPFPASRVMIVCVHCDRPTRVGHRTLDNGSRVRTCGHCGEPLEVRA